MTTLSLVHSGPSITSLEISNIVGKRHDNVRRTIETLAKSGVIRLPATAFPLQINNLGLPHKTKVYIFSGEQGKYDSYVVTAQLAPQFIVRIVDIWGRTESTLDELLKALDAFEVPPELSDMFVYAIREVDSGRIKLGISRDPRARLAQLQTGNSQRLELVAYRKASDRFADEKEAHRLNSDVHIRGEWFMPSAKLCA